MTATSRTRAVYHPERSEGMWAATLRLQAFLLQVTARQARDIEQLRDEIVRLTVEHA